MTDKEILKYLLENCRFYYSAIEIEDIKKWTEEAISKDEDANESSADTGKCHSCQKADGVAYHACPYKYNVQDCSDECNCCSDCEYYCLLDTRK